jgi:hypothetical protein
MGGERCGTCEWFDSHNDGTGDGTCRRLPPVMNGLLRTPYEGQEKSDGIWPMVTVNMWCGEWRAKEPGEGT